MAKKNSQIVDDEITTGEQVPGEPVDSTVNPDGITIDPSTGDSEKVTVVTDEKPVVEDPSPVVDEQDPIDPTPVVENPVTPDTTETPVVKDGEKPSDKGEKPVVEGTGDTDPSDCEKPKDKKLVKINEYKRFNIRFGYSIDSRSSTARRTLSTTEIVKQFVKAPTCFLALETKEDLKDFETILNTKTIKVEDKDGKLVDFSDAAKKHLIKRVTELSTYWIARNSK